jgi:hypothetical protein
MSRSDSKDGQTLSGFIREHEKIITVIGIFGALTAFFASLENGVILVTISYLIFFLLCLELLTHFPKYKDYFSAGIKSISLFAFEMLSCILVFVLFCYVIYYQPVTLGLTVILSLIISMFYINEISVPLNTFLDTHQKTGKTIRSLAIIGIFGMFMFLALLGILLIFAALDYFGIITMPMPSITFVLNLR